jgi:hypothetical protein
MDPTGGTDGGPGGAGDDGGSVNRGGRASGAAGSGGSSGFGGGGSGLGGSIVSAGAAGAEAGSGAEGTIPCNQTPLTIAPRIVRLTFDQLTSSVAALLGDNAAAAVRLSLGMELDSDGTFPPLASPREGGLVNDEVFARSDRLAQAAAKYVREHLVEVTGCAVPATDACVQSFVAEFAERAYRRPATDVEVQNIVQVYTEAKALDVSIDEATEAAVTAVFDSPLFVYRSELGSPGATGSELALAPYEVANELAFFLSNGPPDAALLSAAGKDALATPAQLAPHITRLLASAATRKNLETQVANYFGLPALESVSIDLPPFDAKLRASMQHEAAVFFQRQLWDAPVWELLTSRQSRVDAGLAAIYGIAFPPAGQALDDAGFADVELPEERAGILTLPAMLAVRSPLIPERGVWINSVILCALSPPNTTELDPTGPTGDFTERELTEYRLQTASCATCHTEIDPQGLALGNFDVIGRYRSADAAGRPIDSHATLSPTLGNQSVNGAAELARVIVKSDRFSACLTTAFLRYALPDSNPSIDSCLVQDLMAGYNLGSDPAFSGLVRQIALSQAFTTRYPSP